MHDYVNIVIPPLGSPYTYLVPPELQTELSVGCQVEVSFGRRQASGFVVGRYTDAKAPEEFNFKLKCVGLEELPIPSFLPGQLEFFQWIADYYGEPLSNVLDLAVPHAAEAKINRTLLVRPEKADENPRGAREREILNELRAPQPPSYFEITKRFKGAGTILKNLEAKGFILIRNEEIVDLPFEGQPPPSWAKDSVDLNATQIDAVRAIVEAGKNREFRPFLLHGVTGSGKTEVYIEAIRELGLLGLGALVVVPEIALTPQLIDRFRARLGNKIAVLHSALGKRQRWNSWRALLERRTQIAIGARSAIFAPVHDLGLIIVDEEHDSSYKQGDGIRYQARDLALVLAKMHKCPVVLGSATPSLESYHNAMTKRYHYLSLPSRHTSASVDIELVDMNRVKPWELPSKHISPRLHDALASALSRGEQAFLLYNRRGFANYMQCEKCTAVVKCENCSVTMTYHRSGNILLCHYCNSSRVVSEYCPECLNGPERDEPGKLVERGAGTEKIYDEVRTLFPNAAVERLDRDAASDHDTYRGILDRLRSGATQILVGTQMIAKGHDLPGVTVVGIADCDVGLHLPDFRSAERIFQLLTQAAGRAGRGDRGGMVILQTRAPNHPSLVKTVTRDYTGFAELELKNRSSLLFPPFTRMLRVVAASQHQELPGELLRRYRERLLALQQNEKLPFKVLGPSPAPLEKIKTLWRWHLLVRSASSAVINQTLRALKEIDLRSDALRIIFDVDPQEML